MSGSAADGHWAKWLNVAGSLASLIALGYVWHLFGPESRRDRPAGLPVVAGLGSRPYPIDRERESTSTILVLGVAVVGVAVAWKLKSAADDAAAERELSRLAQTNPGITGQRDR